MQPSSHGQSQIEQRPWSRIGFPVLFALAVRGFGLAAGPHDLTFDRDAYLGIAQNLAQGTGFCTPNSNTPTAFRPPLYPLLLSAGLFLTSPAVAVAAINLIATAGTWWLLAKAIPTTGLTPRGTTFLAIAFAVNPLLVLACRQPMTETLAALLVTATCVSAQHRHGWKGELLLGGLLGLNILCRPATLAWAGLWMLWEAGGMAARRRDLRLRWVLRLLACSFVVAPWGLRNALVLGTPTVTTTHGGYTLHLGNNSVISTQEIQNWGRTLWTAESLNAWNREAAFRLQQELGPATNEFEQDRWRQQQANRWIREHPTAFAQACLYRQLRFWNLLPAGEGSARQWWPVTIGGYLLLWGFALRGGWCLIQQQGLRQAIPWLTAIAAHAGVHLVYFSNARMRAPIEPWLLLLAAIGATAITRVSPAIVAKPNDD